MQAGHIEIICGCMFSGKTEALIHCIKLAKIDTKKVGVFKPKIDTRFEHTQIVSHNNTRFEAISVGLALEIFSFHSQFDVFAIDEVQFFDSEIVSVSNKLANLGKRVILAGLDMDFRGNPFGYMPHLLAVAEKITKLKAKCAVSGNDAYYSYRLNNENDTVVLGASEKYQARSRLHFFDTK